MIFVDIFGLNPAYEPAEKSFETSLKQLQQAKTRHSSTILPKKEKTITYFSYPSCPALCQNNPEIKNQIFESLSLFKVIVKNVCSQCNSLLWSNADLAAGLVFTLFLKHKTKYTTSVTHREIKLNISLSKERVESRIK